MIIFIIRVNSLSIRWTDAVRQSYSLVEPDLFAVVILCWLKRLRYAVSWQIVIATIVFENISMSRNDVGYINNIYVGLFWNVKAWKLRQHFLYKAGADSVMYRPIALHRSTKWMIIKRASQSPN